MYLEELSEFLEELKTLMLFAIFFKDYHYQVISKLKNIISSSGILIAAPRWMTLSFKRSFLQVGNGFRHCRAWRDTVFLKLCYR